MMPDDYYSRQHYAYMQRVLRALANEEQALRANALQHLAQRRADTLLRQRATRRMPVYAKALGMRLR